MNKIIQVDQYIIMLMHAVVDTDVSRCLLIMLKIFIK